MLNLMLHCGGQTIDRHELANVPTPEPTSTWQPIPHAELLKLVELTLMNNGLPVINQSHALARDGLRYFGLLQVQNEHQADYSLVIGLRNSHDMSFPAGLVIGSGVFVCDNLAFSGEVNLARKHTRFILRDLPQLVERAVGQLGDLRVQQDQRIEAYKQEALTPRDAHHLLVQMVDSRVLPVTRLTHALREWREPQHDEFRESHNGWRLFNAVTEAIKGRNLDQLPRRTQALHGIMDSACGLEPFKAKAALN